MKNRNDCKRLWGVYCSNLADAHDRLVSRHQTEKEARAKAKRLNEEMVRLSGCITPGPDVPLYYAMHERQDVFRSRVRQLCDVE